MYSWCGYLWVINRMNGESAYYIIYIHGNTDLIGSLRTTGIWRLWGRQGLCPLTRATSGDSGAGLSPSESFWVEAVDPMLELRHRNSEQLRYWQTDISRGKRKSVSVMSECERGRGSGSGWAGACEGIRYCAGVS